MYPVAGEWPVDPTRVCRGRLQALTDLVVDLPLTKGLFMRYVREQLGVGGGEIPCESIVRGEWLYEEEAGNG